MQFVYSHDSVFPLFFGFSAAEMLNEMIKRINGESRTKFIHWSAHDGNILAFLGFLGIRDGRWPPYGSYIIVEVWKSHSGRGKHGYFLQFRYNGKLLEIPRFSYRKDIPFHDFRKFIKNHVPKLEADCEFNRTKFSRADASYVDGGT
jgi:acid phosphatase